MFRYIMRDSVSVVVLLPPTTSACVRMLVVGSVRAKKKGVFPTTSSHRRRVNPGITFLKTLCRPIDPTCNHSALFQVELLHFVTECVAGDAEQAGGLRLVAAGFFQGADHQIALAIL